MSFAEVKESIKALSREEQREIMQMLSQNFVMVDDEWMQEMERRHQEIAAGRGVTREQATERWGLTPEDLEAARKEWKNLPGC